MEQQQPIAEEIVKTSSLEKSNTVLNMNLIKLKGKIELSIKVIFCQREQEYELWVTEEYLLAHQQLNKCFQKPEDVYNEIVQNFQEMRIDQHGCIQFDFVMGKKRTVVVRLQAGKKGQEINYQAFLELEKLTAQFREYKKKTEAEMESLTAKVQQMQQQNIEQNNKNRELWKLVQNLSSRLLNKKETEIKGQDRNKKQREDNEQNSFQQNSQESQRTITSKPESRKKDKYFTGTFLSSIAPHTNHTFNKFFRLYANNVVQNMKINEQWQNYIFGGHLKYNKINNIKIQVVKSEDMFINIGVLTEELLNRFNTGGFHQNIYFCLKSGFIWKNGHVANKTGFHLQVGSILRMTINLKVNNMQLFKKVEEKEKFIGSQSLPYKLINKKLFFFITLRDQGDAIKVIAPEMIYQN